MINKFWKKIIKIYPSSKDKKVTEDNYKSPEEIISHANSFYSKQDLVFFPILNAYGAFKYDVVKDIFANNKAITVSDVHIALNSVYFSLNEQKHQINKKAAYKHLEFLSKNLQKEPNQFTENLFNVLRSKFPINKPFNLTEYLVNPLIFINILEEYGFLEFMPQFNPWEEQYNHDHALQLINSYFDDSNLLTILLADYIKNGNKIPSKMESFISEIQSDHNINDELLAQFFASMIFSGTHSTSSFLSSFIFTVFNQFPYLLKTPLDSKQLESLENEVLRLYMPVQWVFRTVRENTQYSGVNLKVGDTVILFPGVANLDPDIFEDACEIKFDRKHNHLSFGMGPYACIGKFATHRISMNLVSYLAPYANQIKFLENESKHTIHNAMLKIPLNVIYTEKLI